MRDTRGFTLIEVIIAMVILLTVIAAMTTATGGFVRGVAEDDYRSAAVQLADDRIETVMMDPDYAALEATYEGTETNFPTLAGFSRETEITLVTSSGQNHKVVTVEVTGPGLPSPVRRTTVVAP
jgi:prepilin-type N-terminal cleavage/methylation domain-containing protein